MSLSNAVKNFKIVFTKKAEKELKSIGKRDSQNIVTKFQQLVNGSENIDVKKMVSTQVSMYRLRSGEYRAIFEIHNGELVVLVIKVGHRRDIYDH